MRGQQGTVIARRNPVGGKEQADKRNFRAVGQPEAMPSFGHGGSPQN